MTGIADVARRAGVSKATASRALSGRGSVSAQTRARVAAAAVELGYVPSTSAVSLATGRTRNVGVIMPQVDRWFFAEVLGGVQEALLERGLDLTLYDARPGTAARRRIFEEFLARKRFDGLVAVGLEPDEGELGRILSLGKPVVSIVGEGDATDTVGIDDVDAAQRATEHLLGLGHRRVAFLGGGPEPHYSPRVESERLDGYAAAMRAAGLGDDVVHLPSALTLPAGYAAAADLLSDARTRPTGIVAACDEVAIGAIVAARRQGIQVPARLSVIGIDDHAYAEMFSLTTMRQVPREQGRSAVELLVRRLEGGGDDGVVQRIKPRLVVRSSTGPPPET